MNDYVTKPVDAAALDAALARWVAPLDGAPDDDGAGAVDEKRLHMLAQLDADGAENLLGSLVDMFAVEAPKRVAGLRTMLANGDTEAVHEAAHTLKGTASTIGAVAVAEVSRELELMARGGTLAGAAVLLDRLEREVGRAEASLRRLVAQPSLAAE